MTKRGLYEREDLTAIAERALVVLREGFLAGDTDLGSLLLYSGEAGLGKTSLLAELRRSASELSPTCTVLTARGGEQQRNVPFHVVRQLLQPALAKLSEAQRRDLFESWYDIAAPALGLVAPSEGKQSDPQGVREALDWVMARLAVRQGPLVLIVDDLHWADPESLTWMVAFSSRVPTLPLLAALAFRPEEMPAEGAPLLAADAAIGNRLHLRTLSPDAVDSLVRREFGEDADDLFCRQCWSITGGIPYDLVALFGKLNDRQLKAVDENIPVLLELVAAGKGPAIARRLEKFGPDTYRFAYAAAILDNEIDPAVAARVAGLTPAAAQTALDLLREERILTNGSVSGVLEFVHPTIGTAVYQSMLSQGMRTAMHGKAAQEIIDAGLGMAAASRHLLEIYPDDDPEVVRQLRQAAREHLAVGAPDAARRCLERALQEPPPEEDRAEVLFELGCSTLLTAPQITVNHLRAALGTVPGLNPDHREQATLRLGQALAHSNQGVEAAEVTGAEIDRTPPGPGRIRLQAAHFMWRAFIRDESDAFLRFQRLADLSESLTGSDSGSRAVRVLRAWDLTLRGESSAQAMAFAEHGIVGGKLAEGLGWTNTTWGFEIPSLLGLSYTYNDRLDLALDLFNGAAREFEVSGWSGGHLAFANFLQGLVLFRWGRLEEAENFLRLTLRKSDRLGRGTPLQWDIVGVLCETLLCRGHIQKALELAEEYEFRPPYLPVMVLPDAPTLYGRLLLVQGDNKGAARHLAEAGEQLAARGWHNTIWAPWAGNLAQAIAGEEPERARALTAQALEQARRVGTNSAIGVALRWCATVAEPQEAVELLRQAVEHLGQSPTAYEYALALMDQGATLRRVGRPREALEALGQSVELAAQCGADGLLARGRTELVAAGASPHRLRAVAARVLNQKEHRAAELAAQGLSTQRIAAEMKISESAASQLLASAHRKVGTGPEGLSAALGLDPEE
ncbi:tetratricopeptide (TPR) repeat protein [Streptacidiphilus sp. MAP12-16]